MTGPADIKVRDPRDNLLDKLVNYLEERFSCTWGPPMAFFELPQKDGAPVRVIYVTYAVRGDTFEECESWMMNNVLVPLHEKAGPDSYLYWRLTERFVVTGDTDRLRPEVQLRTRLAVLNAACEPVRIDDMIKPEGVRSPRVTPETKARMDT
jgi:hypothetical protein